MSPIYVLPLGSADRKMITALCPRIEDSLGASVSVREVAMDLAQFHDERRLQFNSTSIITHMNERFVALAGPAGPVRAHPRILAVTREDLFIPILTYVFGEAQLSGRVAVVSYHRLENERYGLAPDPQRTFERLLKECLHELGHVFGLVHCQSQRCVMHTSTYVEDIDLKPAVFCGVCEGQLGKSLGR